MLYCFCFQLIKGSCYLLWTENISSFQETLWSGCTRGTTTDISGDNEHYKQYENEKNVRTFCSEESPIFFFPWNGHAKMDLSCELPFIGKHLTFHESFPPNREAQVAAGLSRIGRCLFIFPFFVLFCLLVFLANPQARTSLPTKAGILLQHCRQSQARPLSITSRLFPSLRLQPFHLSGQTYVSRWVSAPWPQRQGPAACCRARSSGFARWWCWWESCWAGCHCLQMLAGGCSLHRSTFCPGRPSPYINGIAQVNAGKDFSRESREPVSPSCRGIELVAINLIKSTS